MRTVPIKGLLFKPGSPLAEVREWKSEADLYTETGSGFDTPAQAVHCGRFNVRRVSCRRPQCSQKSGSKCDYDSRCGQVVIIRNDLYDESTTAWMDLVQCFAPHESASLFPEYHATVADVNQERVAAVKAVKALAACRITKTPGVCGGSACLVRTRIPIWLMEQSRRAGMTAALMLQAWPTLDKVDLEQAFAYAEANKDEINNDIYENEEDT